MLEIFPFLYWLAALTSTCLLIMHWKGGDARRGTLLVFASWLLLAAYLQFFGGSPVARASGLAAQALLAVVLVSRWRLSAL